MYIDPGSGSLIIQALIAVVVAVPIFFRHRIGGALAFVRGRGRRSDQVRSDGDRRRD